jgi:ubiquinone/menaquinone biosynthesis C-methylase UbiE
MRRYDLTAEMYDARYHKEQEAKYCAALRCVSIDEAVVLDLGCGTGLLFDKVATKAKLLVGIDFAKRLLVEANLRSRQFGNVFTVQADADHLPFRSDSFGAVFAFTVIQNLPMPSQALLETTRVAIPGAWITITGLKRKFSLQTLTALLEKIGLHPSCILDNECLSCYVAVSLLEKRPASAIDSSADSFSKE